MGLAHELQMSWQTSLLTEKRKRGGPLFGFPNLGNSCYLNSVLQCLTYTPPLANFCLKLQHSSLCKRLTGDSALDAERNRDCPFCILEKRIVRSLNVEITLDAPAKIQSCHFSAFASPDVLRLILSKLSVTDLARSSCVCRAWSSVVSDNNMIVLAFMARWKLKEVVGLLLNGSFWRDNGIGKFAIWHRLARGDSIASLAVKYSVQIDEHVQKEIMNHSKLFMCVTCRPGVVKAIEEFKLFVYGDNYDEEGDAKVSEASRKRKAASETVRIMIGLTLLTMERVEKEYLKPAYSASIGEELEDGLFDDFLELALQFGMIMMFACAFPLAFAFAAVSNIMEIRTDALKLLSMFKRPVPCDAVAIGAWINIFQFLIVMSICTNSALLVWLYDQEGKQKIEPGLAAILIMEHVLLLIKFGFSHFVPEPAWVRANRVRNATQAQDVCSKLLLRTISGEKMSNESKKNEWGNLYFIACNFCIL